MEEVKLKTESRRMGKAFDRLYRFISLPALSVIVNPNDYDNEIHDITITIP